MDTPPTPLIGRGRSRGMVMRDQQPRSPGGLQESLERLTIQQTPGLSTSSKAGGDVRPSNAPPILPNRPEFGRNGDKVKLVTNHYEVKLPAAKIEYYLYDVTITQVIRGDNGRDMTVDWTSGRGHTRDECKEIAYKVYLAWANDHDSPDGDGFHFFKSVYNCQKALYVTAFMGQTLTESVQSDESTYQMKLDLAGRVILDWETLATSTYLDPPTERDRAPMHLLDLFTNQTMYLKQATGQSNYMQHGRCFYKPYENRTKATLPMGRELKDGFSKSLRVVVGDPPPNGVPPSNNDYRLTMNIETKKSPFFRSQLLHITAFQSLNFTAPSPEPLTVHQIEFLKKHFLELRCKKTYNERNFKIDGISEKMASQEKFTHEKREYTVVEYFLERYNVRLQFPNLPCVKDEQRNFIPMEVCLVLPNQKCEVKKLTGEMTSQIIREAAVHPDVRMRDINEKARFLSDNNADKFLAETGISRSNEMMKVDGRVLRPPRVTMANNQIASVRNGSWINNGLIRPATVREMVLVCFTSQREVNPHQIVEFAKSLMRRGSQLGMKMPTSLAYWRYIDLEQFKTTISDWCRLSNDTLDLVLCIMDNKKLPKVKNQIKFVEKETEVVTQCVSAKTFKRYVDDSGKNSTILDNLMYKINLKFDGSNNEVDVQSDPIAREWLGNDVMYIGIDVNHPPPLSKREIAQNKKPKDPSVVGFVALTGKNMGDYRMQCRVQDGRQEIVAYDSMQIMVKEAVKDFEMNRGCKPAKVIVYRDGVSESQFAQVIDREILAMYEAFSQMGDNKYRPKLTWLNVQKRHNTRFFCLERMAAGQRCADKNIQAGTVVDTGPTNPFQYDFFLCSHTAIQGTAKAAYYVVLRNDNDLRPDDLQHITNALCYLYQRTPKSVSLPAPVYFAHHAATRGKELYGGFMNISEDSSSGVSSLSGGSGDREVDFEEVNRRIKYGHQFSSRKIFL